MSKTPSLLLATCLCLFASATQAADPLARERAQEAAYNRVYNKAANLVKWGDFAGLARLHQEPAPAATLEGQAIEMHEQKRAVDSALADWQPEDRSNDLAYESQAALLLDWAQRHPEQPMAHIAYAKLLYNQAWAIRGGSFAGEISEDHMARFRAISQRALEYLQAHRKLVESERRGSSTMLWTMRDGSSSDQDIWKQARDYLRLDPGNRDIYRFLGSAYSPRWGGSAEALEYVARESIKITREQMGMAAYAAIYQSAANTEYGAGLFERSLARWPQMKQGFEDLLARVPSFEWRSSYAYFACLAKDRETLRQQLELLGEDRKRFQGEWGSNGARTQADCVRFAEQT